MITVDEIKEKIKKRIKQLSTEPNLDGKMLIGEEFEVRRASELSKDALLHLLDWIEEREAGDKA